jgi:hypothetical protein
MRESDSSLTLKAISLSTIRRKTDYNGFTSPLAITLAIGWIEKMLKFHYHLFSFCFWDCDY